MSFTPTSVFTDWFKSWAHATFLANAGPVASPWPVGAVFYTRIPALDTYTPFAAMEGLSDLDALAEWVPLGNPMTPTEALFVNLVAVTVGWRAFQILNGAAVVAYLEDGIGWEFAPQTPAVDVQEMVAGVVLYLPGTFGPVTDPIMFATTQGIGDRTVVHNESLFGQTTESLGGVLSTGWLVASDTATYTDLQVGSILLAPEEPQWEGAHAQHMWLEPQRTNLIANPSFEGWA